MSPTVTFIDRCSGGGEVRGWGRLVSTVMARVRSSPESPLGERAQNFSGHILIVKASAVLHKIR
jgi:hypothetical protein